MTNTPQDAPPLDYSLTHAHKEGRHGMVSIDLEMLKVMDDDSIRAVFSQLLVLRAENDFISGCIEYSAASPAFDIAPKAEYIPRYLVVVTRHVVEGGYRHTFEFKRS